MDFAFPVVGIVGYSGSGKTTLICKLLKKLGQQGLRCAVVKHSHHSIELDKPGKDSARFVAQGAEQVLLCCPNARYHFSAGGEHDDLYAQLQWINPDHCDLVIVEGYKHVAFPKLEVYRSALAKPLLAKQDPDVFAVATEQTEQLELHDVARLDLNDAEQIANALVQRFSPHNLK